MNRNNNSKKNNSKITSPTITALYCILSLEDGKDNESMSMSISNQKVIAERLCRKERYV
jgi:hypothetical protein